MNEVRLLRNWGRSSSDAVLPVSERRSSSIFGLSDRVSSRCGEGVNTLLIAEGETNPGPADDPGKTPEAVGNLEGLLAKMAAAAAGFELAMANCDKKEGGYADQGCELAAGEAEVVDGL